jgi:hypothetical protein
VLAPVCSCDHDAVAKKSTGSLPKLDMLYDKTIVKERYKEIFGPLNANHDSKPRYRTKFGIAGGDRSGVDRNLWMDSIQTKPITPGNPHAPSNHTSTGVPIQNTLI